MFTVLTVSDIKTWTLLKLESCCPPFQEKNWGYDAGCRLLNLERADHFWVTALQECMACVSPRPGRWSERANISIPSSLSQVALFLHFIHSITFSRKINCLSIFLHVFSLKPSAYFIWSLMYSVPNLTETGFEKLHLNNSIFELQNMYFENTCSCRIIQFKLKLIQMSHYIWLLMADTWMAALIANSDLLWMKMAQLLRTFLQKSIDY